MSQVQAEPHEEISQALKSSNDVPSCNRTNHGEEVGYVRACAFHVSDNWHFEDPIYETNHEGDEMNLQHDFLVFLVDLYRRSNN